MSMPRLVSAFLLLLCLLLPAHAADLPKDFTYVSEAVPDAVFDVRYYTAHNFVGDPIDGYLAPRVILTRQAAKALAGVQADLTAFGLSVKVFDGYRPQRAVDHFVRWGKDIGDTRMKEEFYPAVDKKNLFRDGYIAKKSGHSRGSTVDLTIVDAATGEDLDMGSPLRFLRRSLLAGKQGHGPGGPGQPRPAPGSHGPARVQVHQHGMVALHPPGRTLPGHLFRLPGPIGPARRDRHDPVLRPLFLARVKTFHYDSP